MKQFTILASLLLTFIGSAFGQSFTHYATPGTAINAGTNYAIISQKSASGLPPRVTYLNASTLFASGTATLTAYISTNQTTATATNSTTTLTVASTNGFAAGQWVVISHNALPAWLQNEAAIISSVNGNGTNIVLATTPVNTVAIGDVINQETAWATIPFASSATAREINGPGILTGQSTEPFLLTLVGSATGTNTINTVNATFSP